MSFKSKYLTQGGQMTAYRLRMFAQVNNWIFHWMLLLFIACTCWLFWLITADDVLRNGFWYWSAWPTHSLLGLAPGTSTTTWDIVWHCGDGRQLCTTKMTPAQLLADPWMQSMGSQFMANLKFIASACGLTAGLLWCLIAWYVGRIGKKESEDEFISGMQLTEKPADVNKLLRKNGERSDLRVGDLHMVKNSEVMNFLIHGTISVGKSTIIRWLLADIRKRGDRAIIYDSGCTFTETHYNPKTDFILNAHDERCANWQLWDECVDVVDYENFAASLIPVEGESDPFWVSSSRTIAADLAIRMSADPDRSIEKFLKTLLSLSMQNLREYLANTPSANLVEEKIEKTAISIRSVVTNYAKSLRFLQGLDDGNRPKFTIRNWMTSEQYSNSWLFISTQARHRNSVRSLISMWLSMATFFLQSMGENPDRRVWFIIDEKTSLQRIPQFAETLAEARKFGGCFVIGIQNMPQLINVYGRELAKSIFDLLNTRMYGRSPSAEVAKMVEEDLGKQRRKEAKEQNSYGLDQVRDGVSLGKDKVHEPVVDYEDVMKLPNLKFYVRLPGEYPVVLLPLKYRKFRKINPGLVERNIRDALSPELEKVIRENERAAAMAGVNFPTGEHAKEGAGNSRAETQQATSASTAPERPTQHQETPPSGASDIPEKTMVKTAPEPAQTSGRSVKRATDPKAETQPADQAASHVSTHSVRPSNIRPFPLRSVNASPSADGQAEHTQAEEKTPAAAASGQTPRPVIRTPVMQGVSALDMLARRANKPAAESSADESDSAVQGESPELKMQVEKDDAGKLTVRSAGQRTSEQKSREEASAEQYSKANALMADEEKNILRHRDDYEAYQDMNDSHNPGGHER